MTQHAYQPKDTRPLNGLPPETLRAIHLASLDILERAGMLVPVAEARDLLAGAGARIVGNRAHVPPALVERTLATLRPVTLFDRTGRPVLPLGDGRTTFGTIADTIFVHDPYKRTIRSFVKADQAWLTRVLDALPNLDWIQCVGQAKDVPDPLQTQVAVAQSLRNTTKPIVAYPYDRQGLLDILDLLSIVSGGREAFRRNPFLACVSVPAAPLAATDYNLELLLACADNEVPLLCYCCPSLGANSPNSIAATVAMAFADWLGHMVIHQLRRPGAPVCTSGNTVQIMDMRTTLWSYCAPEVVEAYAIVSRMAHWYGMPAWGIEMTTDTPQIDAQAGAEMMAQCLVALQTGIEMVHNAGILGSGKLCAAEGAVLADEIIGYCRALTHPAPVTGAELASGTEVVVEVGPAGEYLSHPHTLRHFREFWYPTVFERGISDPMRAQSPHALADRLNAKARHIIESHGIPPLDPRVMVEIEALENTWYARHGGS